MMLESGNRPLILVLAPDKMAVHQNSQIEIVVLSIKAMLRDVMN